jgi:single-strand DNA-binding protein
MNTIHIVGNLGGDPEMRYLDSGTPVTNFSVASNRRYSGKDGEPKEETTWFRIAAFGKLAENCNQYLGKGRQVYVVGRIRPDEDGNPRTWEGQDGTTRASFEVTAQSVQFLGSKGNGSDAEYEPPESEEDIPF